MNTVKDGDIREDFCGACLAIPAAIIGGVSAGAGSKIKSSTKDSQKKKKTFLIISIVSFIISVIIAMYFLVFKECKECKLGKVF
jgi:hypothetical protein